MGFTHCYKTTVFLYIYKYSTCLAAISEPVGFVTNLFQRLKVSVSDTDDLVERQLK